MLKARAESKFRTGLSGVQARQSTVKNKYGDKRRTRRTGDFAPSNKTMEDRFDTSEGPRTGRKTGGNKQFITGSGSRGGKSGGTGKLYQYRERGKGGRSTRDKDRGTPKNK
jgi:hypothetical protein